MFVYFRRSNVYVGLVNWIVEKWQNFPAVTRYALVLLVGAGVALAFGADPKVVGGFILAVIALRALEAVARSRALLELVSPFPDDSYTKQYPPLPFDTDKVVEAELKEGTELRKAMIARPSFRALAIEPPVATKYSIAKHDAALKGYENDLREWLGDYAALADRRYRTFHLPLSIRNKAKSSVAQEVRLIVRLGPDAQFVDAPSPMVRPPERPEHRAPQGIFSSDFKLPVFMNSMTVPRIALDRRPEWEISRDRRTATFDVTRVHGGELAELPQGLYVLVRNHGTQVVSWTMSATDGPGAKEGEMQLSCPAPTTRPAETRLAGILRYPDVDLMGEDDGEIQLARREDPPRVVPPVDSHDAMSRLRLTAKRNELASLGLLVES